MSDATLSTTASIMTKADLIGEIAGRTGLTKQEARSALEAFMGAVQEAMEEGKRIELRGFGIFEVQHWAPRTGRNPQTDEPIEIEERYKPAFRPSEMFWEKVDTAHKSPSS